jgi:biotin operon repressor
VIGEGLSWQTARDHLIALRRAGESFTSLRDLAARVGCSEGLIRKAIKSDTGLRAWAAEAKRTRRTGPAATSLERAVRRLPQRREAAPDVDAADSEALADDDAVLQRLIEAASPSERARLHAMPPHELRSLLRLVGEQHADHDRAPLRKRA